MDPAIASESTQTSSVQEPKNRIYVREEVRDGEEHIKDIVFFIEVPLLVITLI